VYRNLAIQSRHNYHLRFLEQNGRDRALYIVGPERYCDYRPLAKEIRCLDAALIVSAIRSWVICSAVSVLTAAGAENLASAHTAFVLPAEDISYRLADRYLPRSVVYFDTVFLRWDKTKTAQMLRPDPQRHPCVVLSRGICRLGRGGRSRRCRHGDRCGHPTDLLAPSELSEPSRSGRMWTGSSSTWRRRQASSSTRIPAAWP